MVSEFCITLFGITLLAVMFFYILFLHLRMRQEETIAAKVREEVNELRKTVLMLVDAGKISASR